MLAAVFLNELVYDAAVTILEIIPKIMINPEFIMYAENRDTIRSTRLLYLITEKDRKSI